MSDDFSTRGANPDSRHHNRGPLSLRARLLLFVNSVVAIATAFFLVLDYQQEFRSRSLQAQIALSEEASTILYAVLHFQDHSEREIQAYIDAVCGSMRNDQSPGHHIAVVANGKSLQSLAHHAASPEMLSALERAALAKDHSAQFRDDRLVVGSARQGNTIVYVSENLRNVRSTALRLILWRLAAVVILAVLAAVVVSLALLGLVARPVERLAETVEMIARGRTDVQTGEFKTAELGALANAINSMSHSLAEAERKRKAYLARARRIQENFLPKYAAFQDVQITHLYKPAADVAGDYFDVLQRPDQTLLFCIADVSGHGIAAALEAVVLKSLFLQAVEKTSAPQDVLSHINSRFVSASLPEDFATMMVLRWKPRSGNLDYASAGHEPAYLLSPDGKLQELASTGLPVGIDADRNWEQRSMPARPGDRLFLVTDGIVETTSSDGKMYGRTNLTNLLTTRSGVPLAAIVKEIEQSLVAHQGDQRAADDVTVVAVEFEDAVTFDRRPVAAGSFGSNVEKCHGGST